MKIETHIHDDGRLSKISNNEINGFLRANVGKDVDIDFTIVDKPAHYLHKWYRGTILPDVAFASGELNVARMHFSLKYEFLYVPCTDSDLIPDKQFSAGYFAVPKYKLFNISDNHDILFAHIKGIVLVYDDAVLSGYIPSTGLIPHAAMEEYVTKCEQRLLHDLNSFVGCAKEAKFNQEDFKQYQKGLMSTRDKAFASDNETGNLFEVEQ